MELNFSVSNLDIKQVEAMAIIHGWKPTITVEEVETPNPIAAEEIFAEYFKTKWVAMLIHELTFPLMDTFAKVDFETLKTTTKDSLLTTLTII